MRNAMKLAYKLACEVHPEVYSYELLKILEPRKSNAVISGGRVENPVRCNETIVWIDINIDGISLFKTGRRQSIPILCRIYGLGCKPEDEEHPRPRVVIPMDMSSVCVIGMYFGEAKPSSRNFHQLLLSELDKLHPMNCPDITDAQFCLAQPGKRNNNCGDHQSPLPTVGQDQPTRKRKISVRVRAMICDGAERPGIKGL